MKKFFIFGLMLIAASNLNAQIEEVSVEQFSQEKETSEQKIDKIFSIEALSMNSFSTGRLANEYSQTYNLMGQQLYCTKDVVDKKPLVALTVSKEGVIGVKKLQKGAYYKVTNIMCTLNEYEEFLSKILSDPTYSNDTIHYFDYNREKIYTFNFKKTESAKEDIKQLLSPPRGSNKRDFVKLLVIYELEDTEGLKYYINYKSDSNRLIKHNFNSYAIVAAVATIDNFISVDTYNYIKNKYEHKDLVTEKYYSALFEDAKLEKYVYRIEKVGINNGEITLLAKQGPNYDKIETIMYGKEYLQGSLRTDSNISFDNDSACLLYGYSYLNRFGQGEGGACYYFRAEVDSILEKHNQENRQKEQAARQEKAKKKEEYTKKYGAKYAEYIIDNKVCAGMTKEMCKLALDSPDEIDKHTSSAGVVEVWTYSRYARWFNAPYIVVTFINGKVSNVEEYRGRSY